MRRVITALVSVADRLVFLFGSGEFPRHTVAPLIIRTLTTQSIYVRHSTATGLTERVSISVQLFTEVRRYLH